ncbi:MAG: alanine--tRNA ligase [bacterium]
MDSKGIRENFLDFFESKGHLRLASASLIPDDPTVLLTIAGMVPFKRYFLGETPPAKRITTIQKCVRTPDIERVGYTRRHLTFFEMLGNFSFGDYFKEEAISWSWEFITERLMLPKEKLWVTIYKDDEVSYNIWEREIGIPRDRIVPMGEEDNFWTMGPVGPCGPCSEIIFDLGSQFGCGKPTCKVGCDCDRYLEIWNLVFTEFNRDETGKLTPLPRKNIDTGMGLERAAFVIQRVNSVFEIDTFRPIIEYLEELSKISYEENQDATHSFNIIADHIRAITFLINDGVLPSNEGRGYILRRIIRRAVRFGVKLGISTPFLYKIIPLVTFVMKDWYPELENSEELATNITKREEGNFSLTLERGLEKLEDIISRGNSISGEEAFKLYDTYGFPIELTKEIAKERGIEVDEAGFSKMMEESRNKAREGRRKVLFTVGRDSIKSSFIGYETLEEESEIAYILKENNPVEELLKGERGEIVTEITPFYPESGGQAADMGTIQSENGRANVLDVQKRQNAIYHYVEVTEGRLSLGEKVILRVDKERRKALARAHTATHLLHSTLRNVLGDMVKQAGSLVERDQLRFDFTYFGEISQDKVNKIELDVNHRIREDLPVKVKEIPLEEALREGAIALFGEKYGEKVRMVVISPVSKELCGGTHLNSTGEIGSFIIKEIYSIGTGIKRVEALVGERAIKEFQDQRMIINEASNILKTVPQEIISGIQKREEEIGRLKKTLQRNEEMLASLIAEKILGNITMIDGINIIGSLLGDVSIEFLRLVGDKIKEKVSPSVILLGSRDGDRLNLIIMASKEITARGIKAGELMKNISKLFNGSGGGKEEIAQGGGKSSIPFEKGLERLKELVRESLKG